MLLIYMYIGAPPPSHTNTHAHIFNSNDVNSKNILNLKLLTIMMEGEENTDKKKMMKKRK